MEDLKKIQEFFSKPLKEGKQLDIEDFAKVVQAVTQTGHPVTVLFTPKWNEIEVLTGMNAPDDMLRDLSNAVDSLGYGRNDIIIAGDSSNLSRREYSQIRRVNGGAKDYWEESLNEAEFTDYSNNELAAYCKNNPTDKKAAKELHKRSQALKNLSRTDEATKEEETEFHTKLDKLVHDTFGKRKGEMEEAKLNEYDPDQDQLDDEDEIFMPYDDEGRPLEEAADQKQADIYAYQFMQYFDKMRRIVGGNFGDDTRKEFEKLVQDKFSKHTVNETEEMEENMSLDDQAKAYYLAKVKSGEIDTLPENPKAAFLAQMTKDQIEHDKETLRRERGLEEVASKVISKIKEDRPGLWANIHAKREKGEKPSHKNSKAYKDAVKAGKKINKEK